MVGGLLYYSHPTKLRRCSGIICFHSGHLRSSWGVRLHPNTINFDRVQVEFRSAATGPYVSVSDTKIDTTGLVLTLAVSSVLCQDFRFFYSAQVRCPSFIVRSNYLWVWIGVPF